MAAFTRLTLYMIQSLTYAELESTGEISLGLLPYLRADPDWEFDLPYRFALTLTNWRIEQLKSGCDLSFADLAEECDVPQWIMVMISAPGTA